MNRSLIIASICTMIIFHSCERDNTPRMTYKQPENSKPIVSENKPITLMPVHIDSTDYIVHAIGEIRPLSSRGFSSEYYDENDYGSTSYSRNSIEGNFSNLHFEHLETHKVTALTDQILSIISARFLQSISNYYDLNLLLYHVYDKDTDGNGKLNSHDIETLYLSYADGSKFTKLTEDFHDLIDYKIIPENGRLYFRTIEDSNKDGNFDKEDKFNNYYVELDEENWKANKYNFIK